MKYKNAHSPVYWSLVSLKGRKGVKAMMALFLIILAAFAFVHFIYEGIVAPSLRANLRLKLFALRDELRDLKIARRNALSDEVFRDLQSSINFAAVRLNQIDLRLLKNAHDAFEHDEKLRKRVAQRIAMFEACPIEELHAIRAAYFELLDYALIVNSGGWVPYLIPIFFGFVLRESAKSLVKKVFSLPDNDIDKIAPNDAVTVPA